MSGWVKMYRDITDWEWYTDLPTCKLFHHLIYTANHKTSQWRGMTIKPGEKVTSIGSLAVETGLTPQQIRTSIKKLKSTGEIETVATNKNTLVIVCNYCLYQGLQGEEQQADNTPSNKQGNKQITNNQQTNNNKQEYKKKKNEKKKRNIGKSDELIIPVDIQKNIDRFIEMRNKAKAPMTTHAITLLLAKLEKLAPNDYVAQNKMLEESIMHAWKSVYPLKAKDRIDSTYDVAAIEQKATINDEYEV